MTRGIEGRARADASEGDADEDGIDARAREARTEARETRGLTRADLSTRARSSSIVRASSSDFRSTCSSLDFIAPNSAVAVSAYAIAAAVATAAVASVAGAGALSAARASASVLNLNPSIDRTSKASDATARSCP